ERRHRRRTRRPRARPAHTAVTPVATPAPTYPAANPRRPASTIASTSTCTVEKVVSPPHNPVPSSARRYRDPGRAGGNRAATKPSTAAPRTLATNVAHGHPDPCAGADSASSTLATVPAAPPTNTAANTRASVTAIRQSMATVTAAE